ncbi:MAG: hypothetical protein QOE90_2629 [Thermoplasmata archaeon]|nr:hypothetical protein [Thermoplasmata archaeon]
MRALTDETRGFLRNVGGLVLGFAAFMLLLDVMLSLRGMLLWMDVPMSIVGLGLLAYAWRAPRGA